MRRFDAKLSKVEPFLKSRRHYFEKILIYIKVKLKLTLQFFSIRINYVSVSYGQVLSTTTDIKIKSLEEKMEKLILSVKVSQQYSPVFIPSDR